MGECCAGRMEKDQTSKKDEKAKDSLIREMYQVQTDLNKDYLETGQSSAPVSASKIPQLDLAQSINFKTMQNQHIQQKMTSSLSIEQPPLFEFNILILGDKAVGKTSLFCRIKGQELPQEYKPTIEPQQVKKIIRQNEVKVAFHFTEYPSQETSQDNNKIDFQNINGVMLLFSLNSRETFEFAQNLVTQNWTEISVMNVFLIANKNDLNREVTQQENQLILQETSMLNESHTNKIVKQFYKMFM